MWAINWRTGRANPNKRCADGRPFGLMTAPRPGRVAHIMP